MVAFTHWLTITQHDGPDHRIRGDPTPTPTGELQGALHGFFFGHKVES
jgi:hypothetical protein